MKLQAATGVTSCVAMKVVVPADHHAGVAASVSLYPYRSISYHHRAKMIASIMPMRWSTSKLSNTTLAYSSSKCQHPDLQNNSSTTSTTITVDNPGFSLSDDDDDDELIVDGVGERITSSEHEEKEEEEEYWINELGRGRDVADLVERLECLEEEALSVGKDNDDDGEGRGREATDYNRRAMIFDKCSQVFQAQALKNRTATTATTSTTSSK